MAEFGTRNILYVTPYKHVGDEERQKRIDALGLVTHYLSPTLLSAFTAMSIASECSQRDIDIVHTFRPEDAIAAISARRISKNSRFKVVFEFPANAPSPRSLHEDITLGVDAWVFATSRLACLAPSGSLAVVMNTETEPQPLPADTPQRLLWVGPLEKNIDNLKEAIRAIGDSDKEISLSVLGTGSAWYAMQAVKMSRALPHPERVQWLGDNYTLDKLLPSATSILQSQADPMPIELDLACGKCLCRATAQGFVMSFTPIGAVDRAQRLSDLYRQL